MDEPEAVSRTLITNHYLCRKPDCFCRRLGEDAAASLSWSWTGATVECW